MIAPSTEPVSPIRTNSARPDAPAHLAENDDRLRRQLRLDPAGWTHRQDMLPQLDRPVDLAVDDEVLASLDLARDDDPPPYPW